MGSEDPEIVRLQGVPPGLTSSSSCHWPRPRIPSGTWEKLLLRDVKEVKWLFADIHITSQKLNRGLKDSWKSDRRQKASLTDVGGSASSLLDSGNWQRNVKVSLRIFVLHMSQVDKVKNPRGGGVSFPATGGLPLWTQVFFTCGTRYFSVPFFYNVRTYLSVNGIVVSPPPPRR